MISHGDILTVFVVSALAGSIAASLRMLLRP